MKIKLFALTLVISVGFTGKDLQATQASSGVSLVQRWNTVVSRFFDKTGKDYLKEARRFERAQSYYATPNYAEEIERYSRAIEMGLGSDDKIATLYKRAYLYLHQNKPMQAVDDYKSILKMSHLSSSEKIRAKTQIRLTLFARLRELGVDLSTLDQVVRSSQLEDLDQEQSPQGTSLSFLTEEEVLQIGQQHDALVVKAIKKRIHEIADTPHRKQTPYLKLIAKTFEYLQRDYGEGIQRRLKGRGGDGKLTARVREALWKVFPQPYFKEQAEKFKTSIVDRHKSGHWGQKIKIALLGYHQGSAYTGLQTLRGVIERIAPQTKVVGLHLRQNSPHLRTSRIINMAYQSKEFGIDNLQGKDFVRFSHYIRRGNRLLIKDIGAQGKEYGRVFDFPGLNDMYRIRKKIVDRTILVGNLYDPGEGTCASNTPGFEKDAFENALYVQSSDTLAFGLGVGQIPRSGTATASLIVSGAAALLMSEFPDLSAREIKEILLESAKRTFLQISYKTKQIKYVFENEQDRLPLSAFKGYTEAGFIVSQEKFSPARYGKGVFDFKQAYAYATLKDKYRYLPRYELRREMFQAVSKDRFPEYEQESTPFHPSAYFKNKYLVPVMSSGYLFSAKDLKDVPLDKKNIAKMLAYAAEYSNKKAFNHLLSMMENVQPHEKDIQEIVTPILTEAAAKGQLNVVKKLISKGVRPQPEALVVASSLGFHQVVEALAEASKNVNTPVEDSYKSKYTGLMAASKHGHTRVVDTLLKHGANVNQTTKSGNTAFHLAIEQGRTASVRTLLKKQDDINCRDGNNKTGLHLALKNEDPKMVHLLVAGGANVNAQDKFGRTIPSWYLDQSKKPSKKIFRTLLNANGVNLDLPNKDHNSVLHVAIEKGYFDIARMLLGTNEINVDSKNKNHLTPIHLALLHHENSVVKLLVRKDADVNVKDKDGNPVITWYIQKTIREKGPDSKVVKTLLDAEEVLVDAKNPRGETALHVAARHGLLDVVRQLVEADADIDARNKEGETPLLLALKHGQTDTASYLIKADAYLENKDLAGNTALKLARHYGHAKIEKMIKRRV